MWMSLVHLEHNWGLSNYMHEVVWQEMLKKFELSYTTIN